MRLKNLEINGFKSFSKKTNLEFGHPIISIVGPNGSGKSNVVEAIRFVLGEQSMKSMRGRAGSDLVFKGSKNLPKGTRAGVTIYFDNRDKVFKLANDTGENINLNYDVISISREVYSDGMNKYILNGSEVRLKDIHNLLASVNIGSSGHHIISQGEADRILNANPKDLRGMVEDALGLKIYQYKIKESERKLERTENNMKEVALLRRENAPHLNFLRKQVEKVEKAEELSSELLSLYREYLKRESVYLSREERRLAEEKEKISGELALLRRKIADTEEKGASEGENMAELSMLEKKSMEIRRLKGELERKLGRVEGMMEAAEERSRNAKETEIFDPEEAKTVFDEVSSLVEEAIRKESTAEVKPILERIKTILKNLYRSKETGTSSSISVQIDELKKGKGEILSEIQKITAEDDGIVKKTAELREKNAGAMEAMRQKERERFGLKVREQELSSALGVITLKEEGILRGKEDFENEIKEGRPLAGEDIFSYKDFQAEDIDNRVLQEELRKKIERIKIKLEDAGLSGGPDIIKEFKEATERDAFLLKELADLEHSMESLKNLMADLKEKIDTEFKEGIKKINKEFQELFVLMFGGGTARLDIVVQSKGRSSSEDAEEDEENEREEGKEIVLEQGVEINVSLPHKKVKELNALSGGERSLTSIALLFAMSQVNPPPFLVLDETDAALDEANSRKYGDMLEKLSSASQLIVVTHNRETMSRAGILYGVTIGADGASKLLSVKFEEATAIAK